VRALSEPSRLAAAVFLLLVVATIGAFFVAQRLKQQPPLLRYRASTEAFSPNGDGIKDTASLRFKLIEADDLTVTVLDEDGGIVRRVESSRPFRQGLVELEWDGQTDNGLLAPEGDYRVRVGLRDEGRTNTLKHTIKLDLTAPTPRIRPVGSGAPVVIDGARRRTATVEVREPARSPVFSVWRTDVAKPRRVVKVLERAGARRARWDGRLGGGRAPAGTYMITAEAQDAGGNIGTVPTRLPPPSAGRAQGGVGVLVRPVAITPPLEAVTAGTRARVKVDAGGRRYSWALRTADGDRVARGKSRARRVTIRIPDGPAGAYVLTVRTRSAAARAVIPVTAAAVRQVLVVLPVLTWQGRNDVDDTGDGLPDSLARDRTTRIARPFARGRLPRGFGDGEARLLAYLDQQKLRYDLATDLELARAGGMTLPDYSGVILAGDTRWLPEALGARLDEFVRDGGRLFSVGFDSLQRTMALGARSMRSPSERLPRDFLGADVGEARHGQTTLLAQTDEINLFAGTAGSLGTWDAWQETADVGRGRLVATASETGGDPVFVAYRLGDGLVIRPGVDGWASELDNAISPAASTTRRIWTLLRR
jgi:flagellar hook assembly protein FlgD